MGAKYDPINRHYALAKVSAFKEQLLDEMTRQSMSRAEFAARMGWTRSAASHFFNESQDITITTADRCGLVLGGDAEIVFTPREINKPKGTS